MARSVGWMALCMLWLGGIVAGGETSVRLGERQVILKSGQLGLKYFPDGAVSVLDGRRGAPFRMLVPAGIHTYLVEGDILTALSKATRVLSAG